MSEPPELPAHAATANESVQDAGDAAPGHGTLVTRAEAAAIMKTSRTTVRRMEGSVLQPVVGQDGVHRFREEHVRQVVERRVRSVPAQPDTYDGATAATVFALFDEGLNGADVVKRCQLHPLAVSAMHRQWTLLRGGFAVDAETARQIAALRWLRADSPIGSGEELLAALRRTPPRECIDCGTDLAVCCSACARARQRTELERRAAREKAEKEAREHQERLRELDEQLAARLRPPKKL